ncbi:MAG TPA: DUF4340 domain-containing protein [Planctomycetaceae bacterium]|nr:DUF4340 domain-containing protein [Planctomycetaceae bacterium]
MNATSRTIIFVAVAGVSVLASLGVKYANRPVANEDFADLGKEFFTDFKDPLSARSLTVSRYDSDAKEPLTFSVQQNDKGQWIIPSHHDYPAEAKDRLARTATSFLGVKKLALQSRSKDDWGRYGVADPSDEVAVDPDAKEGEKDASRGTRVTMRDSGGNAVVDLIIGKPVEGRSQNFYVRQPDKNNIYIAEINADLSAKFSDWIEPDLLKLNQNDIVQVVVDRYSIDEEKGEIVDAEKLEFDKDTISNKWALAGLNTEEESLKEASITDLTRNLDQLKIVGVRPKPPGLNADLTVSDDVNNPVILQILQADMQRQGFFIARGEGGKKKLVSNEGELVAGTKEGVRYTLYFGEIARGSDKDIETGLNEKKPAEGEEAGATEEKKDDAADSGDANKPEDKPEGEKSGPRRYLLVKVEFDDSLMGTKPTEPVEPVKPAILSEEAAPANAPAGEPKPAEPKPEEPKKADDEAKPESTEEPKAEPKAEPGVEPKDEAPAPDAAPEKDAPKDDAAPGTDETPAEDGATEQPDSGACDEPVKEEPQADDSATPATDETPPVEPAATAPDEAAKPKTDDAPKADEPKTDEPKPESTDPVKPTAPKGDDAPEIIPAKPTATDTKKDAPTAEGDEKPTTPETTPAEPQPPVDPKADAQKKYLQEMGRYEAEKSGYADAVKSWEERSKSGKKLTKELSARFGAWYYVISADSFEKLRPTRADVVGPKEAPKPGAAGAEPSFDNPPGGLPNFGGN